MLAERKQVIALYADRSTQQWVVRDADGEYWIEQKGDDGIDRWEPYPLSEETELEPIPGHYKYLLRL